MHRLALSALLTAAAAAAQTAPIDVVDYDTITANRTIDFEDSGGDPDILEFDGVSISEKFAGQTLGETDRFRYETLSGEPTGPLSLQPNDDGLANLTVNSTIIGSFGRVMAGTQNNFFTNDDGNGAVSLLFDNDISEFGIKTLFGQFRWPTNVPPTLDFVDPDDPSTFICCATFEFFRRDGSLIDTVTTGPLGAPLSEREFPGNSFGFRRDGGVRDIAGVSITNEDYLGLFYDDIIFEARGDDVAPIPLPAGVWLLGGALGMLSLARRRGRG